MRRLYVVVPMLLMLAGCATAPQAPEPRELTLTASSEDTLGEVVGLLMEEGYVIRRADPGQGRVEAVLARWPGYRIEAVVLAEGQGARVALTATRSGAALPPHLLDPLLAELQRRLGQAP